MINANKLLHQINRLTQDMIATGLCDDQNFSNIIELKKGRSIVCIGALKTNIFLKNVSYKDVYYEMLKHRVFNFKMLDGALILMQYTFQKNDIIHHRLSFFPSPDLLDYQQNEALYLEDDIYLDILDRQIVTVPLRFDYDKEAAEIIEHPVSHLTIGQYKNCRIPVSSAISPDQFLDFIIRNFYHTAYRKYSNLLSRFKNQFPESILKEEKALVYIGIPPF